MRGYFVAMPGVEEMHLLNLTVAPAWQRRGIATALLDELVRQCRDAARAAAVARGAHEQCRRARAVPALRLSPDRHAQGYYPAAGGQREDALVMGLKIDGLV